MSKCLHLRRDRTRPRPRASGARNGRYRGGVCEDDEAQERNGGDKVEHDGALLRRYWHGAGGKKKKGGGVGRGDGGLGPKVESGSPGGAYVCKLGLGWRGHLEVDFRFESTFDEERARRQRPHIFLKHRWIFFFTFCKAASDICGRERLLILWRRSADGVRGS